MAPCLIGGHSRPIMQVRDDIQQGGMDPGVDTATRRTSLRIGADLRAAVRAGDQLVRQEPSPVLWVWRPTCSGC